MITTNYRKKLSRQRKWRSQHNNLANTFRFICKNCAPLFSAIMLYTRYFVHQVFVYLSLKSYDSVAFWQAILRPYSIIERYIILKIRGRIVFSEIVKSCQCSASTANHFLQLRQIWLIASTQQIYPLKGNDYQFGLLWIEDKVSGNTGRCVITIARSKEDLKTSNAAVMLLPKSAM